MTTQPADIATYDQHLAIIRDVYADGVAMMRDEPAALALRLADQHQVTP